MPGRSPAWEKTSSNMAKHVLATAPGRWEHSERYPTATPARYSAASLVLRRSVISMQPGAWVMQNSGFACAITA
jgi:hypothetical protein